MKNTIITEESDSYKQLKSDIKDKYTKMICADLELVRRYVVSKSSEFFGEDFFNKLAESEKLKQQCDEERKKFRASEEYAAAQKELSEATKLAKNISKNDENADRAEIKRLNKAISAITTLNVTIRNRLKEKTDKISKIDSELNFVVSSNEKQFKEINEEIMDMVKKSISDCLGGYLDELKALNETFGVETNEDELPFDEKAIRLDIPVFGKFSFTENDDSTDDSVFIPSDDNNGVLN